MEKDKLRGVEEFLDFSLKAFIPHIEKEEENLFPVAINQWSKKDLIKELTNEHKLLMEKYKHIRVKLAGGRIIESTRLIKEVIEILEEHVEKEEPLYQLLLNEILK